MIKYWGKEYYNLNEADVQIEHHVYKKTVFVQAKHTSGLKSKRYIGTCFKGLKEKSLIDLDAQVAKLVDAQR